MRTRIAMLAAGGLGLAASLVLAQGPGDGPPAALTKQADADDLVARMLAFDADRDDKLTRSEVTDVRLQRLFDRADANKDGSVTKEELTALAEKEHSDDRGFGPPGGGPGGPMMGPPRPGEILPPILQRRLRLSAEQKAQLDELQKDVDTRLEKILNDEQRSQLKTMRERGPGGFGPPGGFGGPPGGFGRPPGGGRRPGGGGPPAPPDRPR